MEEVKAVHSDSNGGIFIGTGQWQYVGWKGDSVGRGQFGVNLYKLSSIIVTISIVGLPYWLLSNICVYSKKRKCFC